MTSPQGGVRTSRPAGLTPRASAHHMHTSSHHAQAILMALFTPLKGSNIFIKGGQICNFGICRSTFGAIGFAVGAVSKHYQLC